MLPDSLVAGLDRGLSPIQRTLAIGDLRYGALTGSDADEQRVTGEPQDNELPQDLTEEGSLEIEGSGGDSGREQEVEPPYP